MTNMTNAFVVDSFGNVLASYETVEAAEKSLEDDRRKQAFHGVPAGHVDYLACTAWTVEAFAAHRNLVNDR